MVENPHPTPASDGWLNRAIARLGELPDSASEEEKREYGRKLSEIYLAAASKRAEEAMGQERRDGGNS